MVFCVSYKYISPLNRGRIGLRRHRFLTQLRKDPVLVPVSVSESRSRSYLVLATASMLHPVNVTPNAMHWALQKVELVHEEVYYLMQVHTKLAQEVQEATDWLPEILASTQDAMQLRPELDAADVPVSTVRLVNLTQGLCQ